ncbi:DUF2127 domain-containing protein [Tropicimonas isoalkanivorans]|uniref:Uncharacterized membrane protein n=1 Tax=Tropicimonas isoalkanivorans TaxID=441112 RepID=A0A1I1D6R9_9RHOB|nr:DUF2127 domain-containing protein [Tropicimonas isoalkanivorans]SFB70615.1 Uncharacterized membrane protein [Tropicimonas isoalkanivorans]
MVTENPDPPEAVVEKREAFLRDAFWLGLVLKLLHSLIEILCGFALLWVSHEALLHFAQAVTAIFLVGHPSDLVANALRTAAERFNGSEQSFAAWYLLSHGVVKADLVAGVLADRRWAYPAFMAALILFIAYQVYRMFFGPPWALLALTVIDVIVLGLTWHEWRYRQSQRSGQPE